MPSYTADGTSKTLQTDLGSPTLADGDLVYVGRGYQDYDNAASNTLSGNDLLLVDLGPGWHGNYPEAAPLKVVCNRTSTGRLRLRSSGQKSYVQSSSAAGVVYHVEIESAKGGAWMLGPMDTELCSLRAGTLHALATCDINKLYASGFGIGTLYASGPTMAECIAAGSSVINMHRAATLIEAMENATLNVNEEAIAPTNAYIRGGRCNYGGGNMTNLYLYGGVLDLTMLPGPITITNRYALGPTRIRVKQGFEPTWTNKPVDLCPPVIEVV